ncbi:hypothetical protein BATDEDRAFT_25815 [Batrachochytrium dendrobatidis JAM81]|uniref:Cation-transporting P-type ATPase C-terminal domain-containing protein n=2 Tax=Batrachochytrium dendrobatidis TaxID=109871 RepID=F4P5Q2_BATDJ|nr:uncharacterized protein BATDEDRAFT_25815 [Batrachochytrium dendrobatidis JAM81]EGF79461.1 hypothetical protein BATDEDRAFT_25815 [Batrachochytrium dendrobatidis JAM81]|eukprot:XP_006679893.1 hypothetical protein BATDEDRAFT_25815 [Batrachochytrium dendrobatidis JAM81]
MNSTTSTNNCNNTFVLSQNQTTDCLLESPSSPSTHISNSIHSPNHTTQQRLHIYLSHKDATATFVQTANAVLAEQRRNIVSLSPLRKYLLRSDVLLAIIFAIGLVGFYIFSLFSSVPFQSRATGALLEGLLIITAVAFNCWLHVREIKLALLEMSSRLQNTLEQVRKYGIDDSQDFCFPTTIPTVSITRVVRDGTVRLLPSNLLVQDDVILLAYGETAPCKILFLFATNHSELIKMEPGQILKPDLFGSLSEPRRAQEAFGISTNGAYYFKVIESPIKSIVLSALNSSRPETVIAHQLSLIDTIFLTRVIWITLGSAFIVNALRFILIDPHNIQSRANQAYEMLVNLQIYILFPLIPLSYPTLSLISRSYGNAQIVCLFEALQSSKTAFEDKDDVDEFDAAPAPTKNVTVSWAAIWSKFLDQIIRIDISFLARTTGLIESLANTTVICSIDREGTISAPLPSVDQIFLIEESGEPVILDTCEDRTLPSGIRFEDKGWIENLPLLKPLGLGLLLMTDCGIHAGRRRIDSHLNTQKIRIHGCICSARQTCLCRVGTEIGFTKDAVDQFVKKASIELFAPNHASIGQCTSDYHLEIPSMISHIFHDNTSGSFQLFSEGNAALILESCGDFWNGHSLSQMTETVEQKIWEFYQNAIISDLQVVAFAYRPIHYPSKALSQGTSPTTPIYLELSEADSYLNQDIPHLQDFSASSNIDDTAAIKSIQEANDLDINKSLEAVSNPLFSRTCKRKARDRTISKIDASAENEVIDGDEFYQEAIKGQTFLAMASVEFTAKPNVVDVIEDLGLAGIRFVYFSSAPERESKAYAEHLGLEIDWNCCIILSPEGVGPGYSAIHDMKARLPKGVNNIRSHIMNVDDVPLHVSLFAECQPHSIREMVRIFQEHGEVVCCIGSSLNDLNVECFAIADISIAVDPLNFQSHQHGPQIGPLSPLVVAASFNSSPCALTLNVDTSLYSITQIIREARTLATNARQGFIFYMGCQATLSCVQFLSFCLLLPPIFSGYHLIYFAWLLLPLISISFLFSPHLPDVMTNMPVKNAEHLRDLWRFIWYCIVRFTIFPSIICVFVFALVLGEIHDSKNGFELSNNYMGVPWNNYTQMDQSALLFAQNYTLCVYVLYMVGISSTYLCRVKSIFERPPYMHPVWCFSAILS